MALTYPLTTPAAPGLRSIEFSVRNANGMQESPFTFAQKIYTSAGQQWKFSAELPQMTIERAKQWQAFFIALKGPVGTFTFGPTVDKTPHGEVANRAISVKGASQTGASLVVDGFVANSESVVKAGDWFSLGGRLYRALTNQDSDANGEVTLDIWPNLRSSPADNAELDFYTPSCRWRLSSEFSFGYDVNALAQGIQFEAVEDMTA